MHRIFNIIAESTVDKTEAAPTGFETFLDPVVIVLCTLGMCVLVGWLFWFGGFGALKKAPVRRHRQRFLYWPMAILGIWMLNMVAVQAVISVFFNACTDAQQTIISYFTNIILEIALIVLMLIVAEKLFARGSKGFGVMRIPVPVDAAMATVNLLGAFPLIFGSLAITLAAGKLFRGPDFALQVHQTLEILTDANNSLRIMIFAFAAFIVPIFEELLFRGFIQTSLRSVSGKPWTAIVITSAFFAILHPPTHVPALFMLSCGLGYAYERSGSLARPILMHMLFNGFNVIATVFQSS